MTKRLIALWILLIIQLITAVVLWWPQQTGPLTGQPWLGFKAAQVTTITLTEGSSQNGKPPASLTLAKKAGHWQLPADHNFPADAAKVRRLLESLAGLKGSLPVAVTTDAAKRFHVAKHDFATHLVLKNGTKMLADVYVGNAAGANRVYLRQADQAPIETHSLPARLLDTDAKRWRDKQLLHLPNNKVTEVVLPRVTLKHHGSSWQGLKPDGTRVTLDAAKTQALVKQLTQLNYVSAVPKQAAAKPSFSARVTMADKTLTYSFTRQSANTSTSKHAQHNKVTWTLVRSDLPWAFTLSTDAVKSFKQVDIAALRAAPITPKTSHASGSGATASGVTNGAAVKKGLSKGGYTG